MGSAWAFSLFLQMFPAQQSTAGVSVRASAWLHLFLPKLSAPSPLHCPTGHPAGVLAGQRGNRGRWGQQHPARAPLV